MNKTSKLSIFLIFLCFQTRLVAQVEEQPSPLGPGKGKKQTEIGVSLGIGPLWQSGEFFASCDCPSFKDGSGFVFTPGIVFKRDFSDFFLWGIFFGFTFQSATSSYQEKELVDFKSQTGEIFKNIPVLFRERADFLFNQLEFMPFVSYSLLDFAEFRLGFRAGIPFSTNVKHNKELLENRIRLDNGEVIQVTIGNSDVVTLENGKIEKVNSILLSLVPGAGFNFRLTGNFFVGLNLAYYLPLNNYSERGKDYKLNYWLVSFDLRYALVLRKWLNY